MRLNFRNNLRLLMVPGALLLSAASWGQCEDEDLDALTLTISDDEICVGSELTLTAVSLNGGTITWDNDLLNGEPYITETAGEIVFTATSDSEDDCASEVTIIVHALPEVSILGDASICAGASVTLEGEGALVYTWEGEVVDGVPFTPELTATYEVSGVDANGCTNTAELEVVVNALPEVEATADFTEICAGESIVLTGSGADTYAWDNEVVDGESFAPEASGTYTVTGTDRAECENTATIEITVNALPAIEITADVMEICNGESVTLTAVGEGTITWSGDVVDGEAFTPRETATYEVTTIGENDCENTATIEIVVNEIPRIGITGEDAICLGEGLTLSGTGATTYTWDGGVVNGEEFFPTETTTYEVTGEDENGCENTSTIEVAVNALPVVEASADLTEICAEEEIVLTGSGADTYTWDNGAVDGEAFTLSETTTFTVTGEDRNGCVDTETIEITVNALPLLTITADNEALCNGESVTLTAAGEGTITWSGDVVDGEAFTPEATATYEVTTIGDDGCENTATIEIVVNEIPRIGITGEDAICLGEGLTLSGTGATTYTWDGGVVNGEEFFPTETATYEVIGEDENGCENTTTIEVVVNALPVVEAAADLIEICAEEEIVLTGSGADTYTWDNAAVDGEAFTLSETTTFTVTGEDRNGCVDTETIEITVNELPAIGITADITEFCIGGSVVLTATDAVDFTWAGDVVDGESFSPEATATYEVMTTGDNGCENTATIEIIVNALPEVVILGESAICIGDELTLTASGAEDYTWEGEVVDGESFSPEATASYTVSGVDENGCINTATLEVVVNELPIVTAAADVEEICIEGSVILTGSGADTYTWDNDVVNGVSFSPERSGTYTVTGVDRNGCEASARIDITVNALPEIAITADEDEICFGESVTLTAAGEGTITWAGDVVDGMAFSPEVTGTYEVATIDENGCENSTTIEIIVNELPIVTIAGDETVCLGNVAFLGGEGAVSYSWSGGIFDRVGFSPDETRSYTVTGIDENGCTNSATRELVVFEKPVVVATAEDTKVCLGDEVSLMGTGAEVYTWEGDVVDGEGFVSTEMGILTYTVTGTDANGCTNMSTIDIETKDSIQIISAVTNEFFGDDAEINIAVFGGYGAYVYDWDNDGTGDFDDSQDLVGLAGGIFSVVVRDEEGCEGEHTVVIESQLSVDGQEINTVEIFPNPTTDFITVKAEGQFSYEITTSNGQIILNGNTVDTEMISMSDFADGIYFVKVTSNEGANTISKVIKK